MNGADRLCSRRWRFAGCVFDEANWTLVVDGRRVFVEAKPLEVLRELLLKAGQIVTKHDLLDKIWPEIHVVEASLPTAVRKLRMAMGDDRHDRAIIETVSGIGYRITVPVELDDGLARPERNGPAAAHYSALHAQASAGPLPSSPMARIMLVAAGLAIGLAALIVAFSPNEPAAAAKSARAYSQRDAEIAIRALDVGAIDKMIAAGWNPDKPFDTEGNSALNYLLNMCEWNPKADPQRMVLMERTLVEGGVDLDRPNVWGDTAYSIAKAPRYCGPNHPVTLSIRSQCYATNGQGGGLRDRCLATYELERMRKQAQVAAE